jgi:hypothetical protein
MQGLFGRFKKQNATVVSSPNFRPTNESSQVDIEFDEFPITGGTDDDEETNWDDFESIADSTIAYPQPIVPVKPPVIPPAPDLDDWDEALPAATVKNSNTQEVRRGKNRVAPITSESMPIDRAATVPSNHNRPNSKPAPSLTERAIGFWTAILQQFRRILPLPIRQLSDALLTAIVVAIVTIAIWFVDGILAAPSQPQIITMPTTPVAIQTGASIGQISPEQAFIDAIQTQLSDITSQYPDDIIQTLQVDLPRDLAIVRLNPVWYLIGDAQQDLVTDRMWLQAKANHFSKLELQDAAGHSIARSPVVGQHMVILQRRQSY